MYGRRLSRRDVLSRMGAVAAGLGWSWHPGLVAAAGSPAGSFLLSRQGCGRATGYSESNKIVTWRRRTHVAWLDSPPEGFRVRIRSCDRGNGEWSPTVTVGHAHDNHGGPALTVDSAGYLHIVYFPHHHAMCYRRSRRPGDSSEWEEEVRFGERLTYPTLVCGPDDTLLLTARRSFANPSLGGGAVGAAAGPAVAAPTCPFEVTPPRLLPFSGVSRLGARSPDAPSVLPVPRTVGQPGLRPSADGGLPGESRRRPDLEPQ